MDALWLTHIFLFFMASALLGYNTQSARAKTYRWFKQGVASIFIIATYFPISVLFLLQHLYRDVEQTSLRGEWEERLVSASVVFTCLFLIMLVLNVIMTKRQTDYKWQKEGLFSAAIITFCYFFIMGTFIRTH